MIVCGSVDEVFYDNNGAEIERIHLNPFSLSFGCQVPKGVWHSIEVYEPSIIFEAKEGRYGHDEASIFTRRRLLKPIVMRN